MKAALCLEYIGEGFDAQNKLYSGIMGVASRGRDRGMWGKTRKPWVAEISGLDARFGYKRSFLPAKWQRQRSSGTGNRGTELWFILESGNVYEVQKYTSWRSKQRYFVTVHASGDIVVVDEKWVKNRLESTSSQLRASD